MAQRYNELDSLRGLASLSVVFHHCLLSFGAFYTVYHHQAVTNMVAKVLAFSPLHLFWAGHEAVILFFVLSGFVLALPFVATNKAKSYSNYIIKRLCRIYLPYAFAICLSIIMYSILNSSHTDHLSSWFNNMWTQRITFKELISFIFMTGYGTSRLDTATWSLVHELRISFFFPLIMLLIIKWKFNKIFFISLISYILLISIFFLTTHKFEIHIVFSLIKSARDTIYYTGFFIMGALIAKYKEQLRAVYIKLSFTSKVILFGISLMLYIIEWLIPGLGTIKFDSNPLSEMLMTTFIDWCIASSVLITIVFALNSVKLKVVLGKGILIYLGQISYSLYLIHPIILLIFVHFARGSNAVYLIVICVPILALLSAHIMHKFVEIPSIKIGKRLVALKQNSSKKTIKDVTRTISTANRKG